MTVNDFHSSVIWMIIAFAGIGTFLIRLSFIQLFGRLGDVPSDVTVALRFVPVAILAALVVPRLVYVDSVLAVTTANHQLLAGLVAGLFAWRTESMLMTIVAGMGALWLFGIVLP